MRWTAMIVVSACLLPACDAEEEQAQQASETEANDPSSTEQEPAVEKPAGDTPAPAPPSEALAVPEDFEEDMRASITESNYKEELDRLEKTLAADDEP